MVQAGPQGGTSRLTPRSRQPPVIAKSFQVRCSIPQPNLARVWEQDLTLKKCNHRGGLGKEIYVLVTRPTILSCIVFPEVQFFLPFFTHWVYKISHFYVYFAFLVCRIHWCLGHSLYPDTVACRFRSKLLTGIMVLVGRKDPIALGAYKGGVDA